MKTYIRVICFLIILFSIGHFSKANTAVVSAPKPEKVYRIIYIQMPDEWYMEQEKLWRIELDKDPFDPVAWNNYYNAVRYANFTETINTPEKKEKLRKIVEEMEKYIPDSYEYNYIKHCTVGDIKDISFLKKAYEINPERPDAFYDMISHYEYAGDEDNKSKLLEKLYYSEDIAPNLLNYNYNTLMSTEKNAILFTNGDNDTYPAWVLQKVKGIRNDVLILNVSLIMSDKSYLERKLNEKKIKIDFNNLPQYRSDNFVEGLCRYIGQNYPKVPIYFALTVYDRYNKGIKDNLFIVGLASQYSMERIDNVAMLVKNFENRFRLDNLKYDWYSEKFPATHSFQYLALNYAVPMIMLAEHYQHSGQEEKAKEWLKRAKGLAETTSKNEQILQYILQYITERGLND